MAAIIGILVDGLEAAAAATTIVELDDEGLTVPVAAIVYDEDGDGVAPLLSLAVAL
jgi:hypothetical protein